MEEKGLAADLARAEIQATNIAGRPLLHEHDKTAQVGQCLASWQGTDGSLRIAARVTDPAAMQQVRDGSLRGLSLGTDMIMDEEGQVLFRNQGELSVCKEGRRPGTWIDTLNGKTVLQVAGASKERARKGAPPVRIRTPRLPLTQDNPRRACARVSTGPRCLPRFLPPRLPAHPR